MVLSNIFWGIVLGLIGFIIILFLTLFLIGFYRSLKDPDVKAATSLNMSIRNYKKYKQIYEKQKGNSEIDLSVEIINQQEWVRFKKFKDSEKEE